MSKGTLLYNNWLLGGVAVLIVLAIAATASLHGGMAVEMGGLQMTLAPHEDGGLLHLSFVRAA
ncbi:MAG: hypothetical protein KJ871_03760 [Alphaproteobacteria bacterium]|nr:hypothetical protein [Alphaproteobacteria bacterium]MBU2084374.1 hypothetical protein [Alphaproteobacteria bacterium]MBU2143046.1 hypothetical protein [Alphaproteobacteria bacterium]MBU2195916.1 hypothetical protein [Alphaproteobacteria bacterium]